MATVSDEFRQAAAQVQQEVDAADIFENWKPPVAPGGSVFNCIFKKIKATMEEDEKHGKYGRIIVEWLITDGPYKGRTFATFHMTYVPSSLVLVFTLAALITGDSKYREGRMVLESVEATSPYEGRAIIEILGRTGKGGYVNFSIGKLIEVLQ